MLYKFQSDRTKKLFEDVLRSLKPVFRDGLVALVTMATDQPDVAAKAGLPLDAIAATDGRAIYLDSDRLIKLQAHWCCGIIAHELAHVALGHCDNAVKARLDHDTIEKQADALAGAWGFRRLLQDGGLVSKQIYNKPVPFGQIQL